MVVMKYVLTRNLCRDVCTVVQFRCNINMVEHGTKVGALPVGSVDESDQKSYILDPLDKEELEVLDKVTNETVDFRGRPAIRSKSGNWKACFLIFGTSASRDLYLISSIFYDTYEGIHPLPGDEVNYNK